MHLPLLAFAFVALGFAQVASAQQLVGKVNGGGGPIAKSTVTLWAAGEAASTKLSEASAGDDGAFHLQFDTAKAGGGVLYLTARGGEPKAGGSQGANPTTALMAILGATAPKEVTINELTTVASVWTGAQFLQGETLSGHALGLKIASGNVPNLVDLTTGGLGAVIQDPLNSTQTTSLAVLNTLGGLLAGCTRVRADACERLFAASTPPGKSAPTDTLTAARAIALHPWNQPAKLFALLDHFYPAGREGPGSRAEGSMFELDAFVIRAHEKVIDHYHRLRDSSKSDVERERFQRRMDQEHRALNEYLEEKSRGAQRAA